MRASPYLAIALAVVSVSFSSIFIRWSESNAITIALYRLTFASLIILPFAAMERATPLWTISRRDLSFMAGVGVILAAHFSFWITSLQTEGVTVASSVILVTSHPVLVALVSHFAVGERVSPPTAVGIGLGMTGVAAIAIAGANVSSTTLAGTLLALLGGVMAGIYFLAGRQLRQRVSLPVYAFVVYASAALTLFALAAATGALLPEGNLFTELSLFLAMAVIPQIGGHTLYNWSLRFVPAAIVSLSLVGEPIGSSILAWLLLAETPGPLVAVGGIFALSGISLTAYFGAVDRRGSAPSDAER